MQTKQRASYKSKLRNAKAMLSFLVLWLYATQTLSAYDFEVDGIYYDRISEGTASVAEGYYSGMVVIPEEVTFEGTSYRVTAIGNAAFYHCDGLTVVMIPNSITTIGELAFFGCNGLTAVTIGSGVTAIGQHAFTDCNGLTEVHISDIAAWCNIKIENGYANPLYYAHHLYLGDTEITSLMIPEGVTSVGDLAFYNCSSLTGVTIPNSVTTIGRSAFVNCSSLTEVTIPNGVTEICDWVFSGCSELTEVTIGSGVTTIGSRAFDSCNSLQAVHSLNTNTPGIEENTFSATAYSQATLYVPKGSKESYEQHPYWGKFLSIQKEDAPTTEVEQLRPDGTSLRVGSIYTPDGTRLRTTDIDALPAGMYIVNGKKMMKQ